MTRARLFARRLRAALLLQLTRAGWPGVFGLALAMFALAFAYSGNHARTNQLAEIAAQRAELASQLTHGAQMEASPRERLVQFYQRFPGSDSLPDILLQLDAGARKEGLAPRRADYAESAESGADKARESGTRRVRINMPVKGSYAALRAWLNAALLQIPTLSVEALELQRPAIAQTELDAQVRLIVYLKGARP